MGSVGVRAGGRTIWGCERLGLDAPSVPSHPSHPSLPTAGPWLIVRCVVPQTFRRRARVIVGGRFAG